MLTYWNSKYQYPRVACQVALCPGFAKRVQMIVVPTNFCAATYCIIPVCERHSTPLGKITADSETLPIDSDTHMSVSLF